MENYTGKLLDGRYEMQEIIGVGGMAVVYKAYDNLDDRTVAVKILKDEFLANDDFRRRFKNESKAIAILSHPNIVKVYDVSFGDRLQYIVMEYVDGITLKEYIEQTGAIAPEDAVYFAMQILRALQHAHDKGIIHRDIKPQNIMLLENGNIKVTDFGIARFSRSESRTLSEKTIGSVHYISPEQAKGGIVDERADIYSVGVMIYEMLTGQLPFRSENPVSVAIMQLQSEAKRPSTINPDIPVGLEQITMKAMRKNVDERYQSAAEALHDLELFESNPEITFGYDYFIDKEPTKYFDPLSSTSAEYDAGDAVGYNQNGYVTPVPQDEEYDADEEEEDGGNTKLVKTLTITGIAVAAVLVIIGILWITGVFGGSSLKVPNFVGMNYAEEIENNPEYAEFEFEISSYETSDEYDVGVVINQTPKAESKVRGRHIIKLVISKGSKDLTDLVVPDIYNMDKSAAETVLKSYKGLQYEFIEEASETIEEGRIIRTDPEIGEPVVSGQTVKVYVSIGSETKTHSMPTIMNMSREDAVKQLEKFGFKLGTSVEADSTLPKGYIIDQSVEPGLEVPEGTVVDVTVSNGNAPAQNVSITVTLPDADGGTGALKVYIDNVEDTTNAQSSVRLAGGTHTITLSGNSSNSNVAVTVDGKTIYEASVNFQKKTVTNERTTKYVMVPNVMNVSSASAESTLKAKGFNVTTKTDSTPGNEAGIVYSQSQSPNTLTSDMNITIYVGAGNSEDMGE